MKKLNVLFAMMAVVVLAGCGSKTEMEVTTPEVTIENINVETTTGTMDVNVEVVATGAMDEATTDEAIVEIEAMLDTAAKAE